MSNNSQNSYPDSVLSNSLIENEESWNNEI